MTPLMRGDRACFLEYARRRVVVRERRIFDVFRDLDQALFYRAAGSDHWFPARRVFASRADAVTEAKRLNALPVPEGSLR